MDLKVYGVHLVMELTPVRMAARRLGGDVSNGGAAQVIGKGHLVQAQLGAPGVINKEAPIETGDEIADIGCNAETQLLRLSAERPDMRVIMTPVESIYRIVARRSAGIASIADLRGKRVATYPQPSAGFYLVDELRRAGMTERDVRLINAAPAKEIAAMLIDGRADAIAVWEPAAQSAYDAIGEDAIAFRSEGAYRMLFGLNTTKAVLDDPAKRREVVRFLKEVAAACRDIEADPSIAWPLAAATSGFPEAEVRACWEHHRLSGGLAPDLLDILVAEEEWSAVEQDRAPRTREELALLIDEGPLREALASERA